MSFTRVVCTSLAMGWLGLGAPAGAAAKADRMTLTVSPEVALAPAYVRVRAYVQPDRENRGVEIVAESDDFHRSSVIALDGERAPRMTVVEYRGLPGGAYVVKATLFGSEREARAVRSRQVSVRPTWER